MKRYSKQIIEEHILAEKFEEKIRMLEEKETQMILSLKDTQNNQRQAYTSLASIVNVGRDYYH